MSEEKNEGWKDKKAVVTRCFTPKGIVTRPDGSIVPARVFVTLNTQEKLVGGTTILAMSKKLEVNPHMRYVLQETAIEYAKQLKACRRLEKMGKIVECDPELVGTPFIPKKPLTVEQKQIIKLETDNTVLLTKIKEQEHAIKAAEAAMNTKGK